jgi:hypothetical protein
MSGPLPAGRQNSDGAKQAAQRIANRISGVHGLTIALARNVGEPSHRLEYAGERRSIAVRTVLAETRRPQDHEFGLDRPKDLLGQSPAIECAGPEVFDQDVKARQEPLHEFETLGGAKVERDQFLVAVDDLPPQRFSVAERTKIPRAVANPWHFDFQHIRPVIREQGGCERSRDDGRQVENP